MCSPQKLVPKVVGVSCLNQRRSVGRSHLPRFYRWPRRMVHATNSRSHLGPKMEKVELVGSL